MRCFLRYHKRKRAQYHFRGRKEIQVSAISLTVALQFQFVHRRIDFGKRYDCRVQERVQSRKMAPNESGNVKYESKVKSSPTSMPTIRGRDKCASASSVSVYGFANGGSGHIADGNTCSESQRRSTALRKSIETRARKSETRIDTQNASVHEEETRRVSCLSRLQN